MNREETIKWLKSLKAEIGKSEHRTLWHYAEAIDMAIETLSADTVSREQYDHACEEYNRLDHKAVCIKLCDENCEYEKGKTCYHAREHSAIEALQDKIDGDLISRADAMGAVQDHFNAYGFKGYYDGQKMMDRITALPSAEAVQGVGRYEKAMQKLREMPKYLRGIKEKQIKKIPPKAVEIVRCKDCRHTSECQKIVQYTRNELNTVSIGYLPIEWCSRGERSET